MPKLDPFAAEIVAAVRRMSDEAILALVRNRLAATAEAPSAPRAAAAPSPRRAASAPAATKSSSKKRQRISPKSREKLMADIERVVTRSKGLGLTEIAERVGQPKTRVGPVVRALRDEGRLHMAGERRFARYAGDAKTARAATKKAQGK